MSTKTTLDQPSIVLTFSKFEICPSCQNEACVCPFESEEGFHLVDYTFKKKPYESGECIHIDTELGENDDVQDSEHMIRSAISVLEVISILEEIFEMVLDDQNFHKKTK